MCSRQNQTTSTNNLNLSLKGFLIFIRNYLSLRPNSLILAAMVGLIASLLAIAFRFVINNVENFTIAVFNSPHIWYEWIYLPLIPTAGGALAGKLIQIVPEARGSGIPEIKLHLSQIGKGIYARSIIARFFGGAIGIGSGISLGREGPTISLGASSGRLVSVIFGLKGTGEKQLIAAGAGAGVAAAFNTPIAGVVFVAEELLHSFSPKFLAHSMLAAVIASFIARNSGAESTFFIIKKLEPFSLAQIPFYIFLGVISGFLGVLFVRIVIRSQDEIFDKLKKVPIWLKLAIAGYFTGIIGMLIPHVLGSGQLGTQELLLGKVVLWIIPFWFLSKFILSSFTYGFGAPGGIFGPSLFCGAALGLFFGKLINLHLPYVDINATNMAIVGMAAFLTGVVKTPVTSIVIIFEMTGDYQLILPLMLSCMSADVITSWLKEKSIYPALVFKLSGIDLSKDKYYSHLANLHVHDVMSVEVDHLLDSANLSEAFKILEKTQRYSLPVVNNKGIVLGKVTIKDLEKAYLNGISSNVSVDEIMTKDIVFIIPEMEVLEAIELMKKNNLRRAIVVNSIKTKKLAGIIAVSDIFKAEVKVI